MLMNLGYSYHMGTHLKCHLYTTSKSFCYKNMYDLFYKNKGWDPTVYFSGKWNLKGC